MATQAESLAVLRAAANEGNQAENEELLRIGAELSQALDERDEAVLKSQRVQYDNEVMRKQLSELRSIRGIPAPPASPAAVDPKIVEAYK